MEAKLRKETVHIVSQYTLGLESVSDDVAQMIIDDTEYRLRHVLQEAVKFMRNSKRVKLMTKDINAALLLKNMEPIFGYSAPGKKQFRSVSSYPGLYVLEDDLIDLRKALEEPLPKPPLEPALEAHWLAIEGVQPAIWQNPVTEESEETKSSRTESVPIEVVKPLKHALSKEFQLFYDRVITIIREADQEKKEACLKELCRQPGIQQLVPYFTLYIHEEVRQNNSNTNLLYSVMQLTKALISNDNLHLEPYLHQLMPSILTCIVGKRLYTSWTDNHWELRDYAAGVLGIIYRDFGKKFATLQSRIIKTLVSALVGVERPWTTRYGAIIGLMRLGFHQAQLFLMPHISYLSKTVEQELENAANNTEQYFVLSKVYGALVVAAHFCLKGVNQSVMNTEEEEMKKEQSHLMFIRPEILQQMSSEEKNQMASLVPQFESLVKVLYEQFGESLFPLMAFVVDVAQGL
eukprot:jgi/Galph1/541/GphlegSOOS_G5230.1